MSRMETWKFFRKWGIKKFWYLTLLLILICDAVEDEDSVIRTEIVRERKLQLRWRFAGDLDSWMELGILPPRPSALKLWQTLKDGSSFK